MWNLLFPWIPFLDCIQRPQRSAASYCSPRKKKPITDQYRVGVLPGQLYHRRNLTPCSNIRNTFALYCIRIGLIKFHAVPTKMWKRLQGHGREKERHAQIGNPVLLETTYDEDQLRRNPNVVDAQNANHGYNAHVTQPK